MYIYIYIYTHLSLSLFIYIHIYTYIFICIYIYIIYKLPPLRLCSKTRWLHDSWSLDVWQPVRPVRGTPILEPWNFMDSHTMFMVFSWFLRNSIHAHCISSVFHKFHNFSWTFSVVLETFIGFHRSVYFHRSSMCFHWCSGFFWDLYSVFIDFYDFHCFSNDFYWFS